MLVTESAEKLRPTLVMANQRERGAKRLSVHSLPVYFAILGIAALLLLTASAEINKPQ
jgi:hypothetical protein